MSTKASQDLFQSYWHVKPGAPKKPQCEGHLSSLFRDQLTQLRHLYQLDQPTFGRETSDYIRRVRSRGHDLYVCLAHLKWNRLHQERKDDWYEPGAMILAPRLTLRYYQRLSRRQRKQRRGADFYEIASLQMEVWLPNKYPVHKPAIHLHQFKYEGKVRNHDDLEWMLTPTMICTLNEDEDWQVGVNANLVGIIDTITDWLSSNLFEPGSEYPGPTD